MITPVFCSKESMTRASMPLVSVMNGGGPITFMFLPRHKKASAGPTLRMSKDSYRSHFPWSSCWFSFLPPLWVIPWPYRQILRCKWTLDSIHSIPYILQPHPTLSQMEGTSISGSTVGSSIINSSGSKSPDLISHQPRSYHVTRTTKESKLRSTRFFFLIRLGNNRFSAFQDETKVPQETWTTTKHKKRNRQQAPERPGVAKEKRKKGRTLGPTPPNQKKAQRRQQIWLDYLPQWIHGNSSTQNELAY